jgi:DNA-binding transcriptional LysR family regulator
VELRQIRYFVTLAEELHFGRAAAREHIVQSALSQQIQRLEREIGTRLLDRTTHHVALTPAGAAFLPEARGVLASVERAARAARHPGQPAPTLRVGVTDAGYDWIPLILRAVQEQLGELEIHQVEACVPAQLRLLSEGRLDVGFGRALHAPAVVASELVRLDPLGVLADAGHRLATVARVDVDMLAGEPLLLAADGRAPEFNEFVRELCRDAGFVPTLYPGSVHSVQAASGLVRDGRCLAIVPSSYGLSFPGTVWRPLTEPQPRYPWSVLWRASDTSSPVRTALACAREYSRNLGWLAEPGQPGLAASA